jgi:cobalt/nickel transport system permease protein
MGAGHAHALYVHEHSPVHRLAPQVKLAAAFGFVLAVAHCRSDRRVVVVAVRLSPPVA